MTGPGEERVEREGERVYMAERRRGMGEELVPGVFTVVVSVVKGVGAGLHTGSET